MKKRTLALIAALVLSLAAVPAALAANTTGTAYAATQNVEVDGKAVEFQMYGVVEANGYGTNYVKLRDVAHVLSGTPAQFEVGYDGGISITTGVAYTNTGTEMTTPFSGDRTYAGGPQAVKVNGQEVSLDAIALMDDNGGGYTYFKLRDLGTALGFTVDWVDNKVVVKTGAPTNPTTPTIAYYTEFPDVPDLGAYFGISLVDLFIDTDGGENYDKGVIYSYDPAQVVDKLDTHFDGYLEVLKQSGYLLEDTFKNDEGNSVIVYRKDSANREVFLGLSGSGSSMTFDVIVFEGDGKPATSTVTYYKEFPDVPDFGAYFSIPRYDTFVDTTSSNYKLGVIYIYDASKVSALLDQGVEFIDIYDTLLKNSGYRYTDAFDDDDGFTTLVYEKGNNTVMMGLSKLNNQVRFTIYAFQE